MCFRGWKRRILLVLPGCWLVLGRLLSQVCWTALGWGEAFYNMCVKTLNFSAVSVQLQTPSCLRPRDTDLLRLAWLIKVKSFL